MTSWWRNDDVTWFLGICVQRSRCEFFVSTWLWSKKKTFSWRFWKEISRGHQYEYAKMRSLEVTLDQMRRKYKIVVVYKCAQFRHIEKLQSFPPILTQAWSKLTVWHIQSDIYSLTYTVWLIQYDTYSMTQTVWHIQYDTCSMTHTVWYIQYDKYSMTHTV